MSQELSDSLLPRRYQEVGSGYGGPRLERDRRAAAEAARRRRRRLRRLRLIPLVVILFGFWSLVGASSTPGNQSFSAKWADWMRGHHAGVFINHFEAFYYSRNAPAKGGHPTALNKVPLAAGGAPAPAGLLRAAALPAPHAVQLVVDPALPGEGAWQPVGPSVGGAQGIYEAQFRADTIYTKEITSAVWIDPKVMKVALVPGQSEPGGAWPHPPYVTDAERATVAAAFNGGFRFQDAQGGFYLDGRMAVPLRTGAASFVLYRNGRVDIGAWGSEVTMSPDVVAVTQNLIPMVDNGVVAASATHSDAKIWGSTLGAATVVARSGIGVTSNGALVYVAGPALTARTLAESLQRAGAVRAMTLDINPEWVTFNFYSHPNAVDPAQVVASKLYPQMQRPATRYLGPTQESREFFTVSAR